MVANIGTDLALEQTDLALQVEVALAPHKQHLRRGASVIPNLLHPRPDLGEAPAVRDAVYDDCPANPYSL